MKNISMKRKIAAAAFGAAGIIGLSAGAASASSGVATSPNSSMSANYHSVWDSLDWSLTHAKNDGYCARGYYATYDNLTGWSGWHYLNQACNNSTTPVYNKSFSVANGGLQGFRVKVCTAHSDASSMTCGTAKVLN